MAIFLKKRWPNYPEASLDKNFISRTLFFVQDKDRFFEDFNVTSFSRDFVKDWDFSEVVIAVLSDLISDSLEKNDNVLTKNDWTDLFNFALHVKSSDLVLDFVTENKFESFSKKKEITKGASISIRKYLRQLDLEDSFDFYSESFLKKRREVFCDVLHFLQIPKKDIIKLKTMVFKEKNYEKVNDFFENYNWIENKIK